MASTLDGAVADLGRRRPVSRDGQNLADVHDRLRSLIIRGEIPAGEIRSQVELARRLDVGRTPLREALRMLQHEGLVLSEPNRRVRISEFSIPDVEDLYVLRIALEGTAIRTTVPVLTPEDYAELEGLMAQMDHFAESQDLERLEVPHRRFHSRLVAGAGERVRQLMSQCFDHAVRYRRAYKEAVPQMWAEQRAEHRAILDAAERREPEAASAALVAHYARTARGVIRQLDPAFDPSRLETAVRVFDRH